MDNSVFENLSFDALQRAYEKIVKHSPVCEETSETLTVISELMAKKAKKEFQCK